METIAIGNKKIGENCPVYIIAEAGVNHNGDIELAKKLIDEAAKVGADAVKFQTFKAELIITKDAKQADYQIENTEKEESQLDMLKRLELKDKDFEELKVYCELKNINFLSTPHSDEWSVDLLENLNILAYKIGSGDLTNIPILRYVAKLQKPIFLSTGMGVLKELAEAKKTIESEGNNKLVLMQCTTMYPTPFKKANLNAMLTIKNRFKGYFGFSDHTQGLEAGIISVCLGAQVYEKHFTLDSNMAGPDHKASIEPNDLKSMIKAMRFVEKYELTNPREAFERLNSELGYNLNISSINTILGKSKKEPEIEEIEIAKVIRKSVVASNEIKIGEFLSHENVSIKRPGTGLKPKELYDVLGKIAIRNIKKDALITHSDLK